MKRKKRKYILLIIAAFILPFSIAFLYSSIEELFFYGKAQATIISVNTEEREGGTSGDTYYYTESELKCSYTVGNFEYRKRFEIKSDYSGWKGKTITILYNKENPYECVMESQSVKAFLYSIIFTAGSICYIVFDIKRWVNIRKEENDSILQAPFSDSDMQQYTAQRKKQKRINIILIIASILGLVLFVFDIPLIVYTIARNVDYRSCNNI